MAERTECHRQIHELLDAGMIEPSQSEWGSPILFVAKKDGGLHMCCDFRMVNSRTVKHTYPLPPIDEKKYARVLDKYYELRGWTKDGVPTPKRLETLNLKEVAEALKKKGLSPALNK